MSDDSNPVSGGDVGDKEHRSVLKQRSITGGAITMVSQFVKYVVHVLSLVVMARLVTPEDYGIVTMVTSITAVATLLKDLGLSNAAIQKQNITDDQVHALFWLNTLVSAMTTVVIVAAAPLIAAFYHRPELVAVTLALSINSLLRGLAAQPSAMLTREMRFGVMCVVQCTAELVGLVAGVVVALAGGRYWALIAIGWTVCIWNLAGTWMAARFWPRWPRSRDGVRELVTFGANVTGFDLVNYFHRNLDNVLIGRFWGAEQMGLYSRAYALLVMPLKNLRGPMNRVAFPAMSQIRDQPDLYRTYYRKHCSILAFLSMPLVTYLFVTAPRFINFLLGSNWLGVAELFRVLAFVAFIQPSSALMGLVLMSSGLGNRYFRLGLGQSAVTVLGFVCGLPWGARGVATGYCVATYVTLHPAFMYSFRGTPLRPSDYYRSVARPALSSVAMGVVGALVQAMFRDAPDVVALAVTGIVSASAYLGVFTLFPGGMKALREYASYGIVLRDVLKRAASRFRKQ